MKKLLVLFASLIFAQVGFAQTLDAYKVQLSEPVRIDSLTVQNATVVCRESPRASAALARTNQNSKTTFDGYRIVVFFANGEGARAGALAAREEFAQLFPDQKSYIVYETPYYKVAVGNCVGMDEALVLLGRVKEHFTKAFPVRETIKNSELVMSRTVE